MIISQIMMGHYMNWVSVGGCGEEFTHFNEPLTIDTLDCQFVVYEK